jgi:hypothetical protein
MGTSARHHPPASNPSLNSTVAQPSSGSGAGQGHASGSGSGSGAATTAHENDPRSEDIKAQPMTASGAGSDSGPGSYSGSATVTGYVWLDNNGDGGLDDNEMDYAGATVNLLDSLDGGQTWYTYGSTTTSNATQGYNYSFAVGFALPNNTLYEIQVVFPPNSEATIPGASEIDAEGFSQQFGLAPGAVQIIIGGLASMTVTTTADDVNANGAVAPIQNQITLRDAIQTGNNGGGILSLTKIAFTGNGANGTIGLKKALDPITRGVNIVGPGASALTVSGANSFRVFQVQATTTISGLTIANGSTNGSGGGVFNSSSLTLNSDIVKNNQAAAGDGGGVDNASGATLTIENTSITGNSAKAGMGGGVANAGKLITDLGTQISGTNSAQYGGGIANLGSGAVAELGPGTDIFGNTASAQGGVGGYGGGIYNSAGKLTMGNSTPSQVGAAIYTNSAVSGGGLYVVSGAVTISEGVAIYKNQATNGAGGGVYIAGGTVKISGGSIYGNTTTAFGGGIYTKGGTLTLTNETIGSTIVNNGNQAKNGKGGGMYLANGSTTNFVNNVTVPAGGNTAKTGPGIYVQNGAVVQANGAVVQPQQLKPPVLTDNNDPNNTPVTGA